MGLLFLGDVWPAGETMRKGSGGMGGVALSLNDLKSGLLVSGVVPDRPVRVVTATMMQGFVNLFYVDPDGRTGQEVIDDESVKGLRIVSGKDVGPRFDADPDEFRLAAEALRIQYAALYDPMSAVYSSDINPLPHQIRAVYGDMLTKVPLRFLLADDPGAGKTIMAGLYVNENARNLKNVNVTNSGFEEE